MIHYQLRCSQAHGFDGWFRDSAAFEHQAASGLLECPSCGDVAVTRALMAPALARPHPAPERAAPEHPVPAPAGQQPAAQDRLARAHAASGHEHPAGRARAADASRPVEAGLAGPSGGLPAALRASLQALRAEVERHCDNVGEGFAEAARRLHRGEPAERGIYGQTTPEQAEALAEEGIVVTSIPWVPRADG